MLQWQDRLLLGDCFQTSPGPTCLPGICRGCGGQYGNRSSSERIRFIRKCGLPSAMPAESSAHPLPATGTLSKTLKWILGRRAALSPCPPSPALMEGERLLPGRCRPAGRPTDTRGALGGSACRSGPSYREYGGSSLIGSSADSPSITGCEIPLCPLGEGGKALSPEHLGGSSGVPTTETAVLKRHWCPQMISKSSVFPLSSFYFVKQGFPLRCTDLPSMLPPTLPTSHTGDLRFLALASFPARDAPSLLSSGLLAGTLWA
ncbi:Hypothetical predicted protein [Marmota monax]|uniref:Uncharacterized protein n=1 Tax=Marmota monax TaxID=9995 RepID=A0A5E4C648_MARMO|nr:hypothetical protein GHT09_018029 [Marmota monax]VTJ77166.1 Hypothetical predicted protein [Marmota monax]